MSSGTMKISLFCILFSLLNASCFSAKQSYIVYMGAHNHGPDVTQEDYDRVENRHHHFLASYLGSHEEARDAIFDSYKMHINGFAAILDEKQAAQIAKHPDVISVFPNHVRELHTTRSWSFMKVEENGEVPLDSIWVKARFGEDTIIGNLDTGVWPESMSFNDEGYGDIPSRWKGVCENHNDGVRCNKKLIGARHFYKGYVATGGQLTKSMNSSRDFEGHGSHTLSTAGGEIVQGASILGIVNGTAKGGSPRARVAAYKVCWPGGCTDSDILAGLDMAINDGVDVISVSLGGPAMDYFNDALAIGAFHAVRKGIIVVCSAGNSGPDEGSVTNTAPWIITVGASTMDRRFQSVVELNNGQRFKGSSLTKSLPEDKQYQLISADKAKLANASADDAILCKPGTLDESKAKGKIMACLRGETDRVDKGVQAALVGAVGMILCNDESTGNEIIADLHVLPASHLTYEDGKALFNYINSTKNPTAYIGHSSVILGVKPAPYMAAFSSKGPNVVTPEILKPDITAPGVNVIAAYSGAASPTDEATDKRRVSYMVDSGTSMSCPHISGIVGLLRTLYPTWSGAAIRSAIMTTARTRDNTGNPMMNATYMKADPFSYGAGHVRPNRAMDPGLVYDLTINDYLDFLCNLGHKNQSFKSFDASYNCNKSQTRTKGLLNLNYPSIAVPNLNGSITVTRTVKNVGTQGTYISRVRHPNGVKVNVKPNVLKFEKVGEEKRFKVTLTAKHGGLSKGYEFGELLWSDGKHYVRSPIAVARN